jgi:hypothetical protein
MELEICTLEGATLTRGVKLKGFGTELTPVPDSGTTDVTVDKGVGRLWMVRVPLRLPNAVGVNRTRIVQVCAGARETGQLFVWE